MRFLRSNRVFDGRMSQKVVGLQSGKEGENKSLLLLRKNRAHVIVVQKKELYSARAKMSESKGYKSEPYWIGGRTEGEYIAGHRLLPNHG